MKILVAVLIIALEILPVLAADPSPPADLAKARAEWKKKRDELDEIYFLYAEKLIDEHTKAGRLDDAVALRDELTRLKAESKAADAPIKAGSFIGTWKVRYTNKFTRTYVVDSKHMVRSLEDKAYFGKINYKDDEAWVTYGQPSRNEKERFRLVDGYLFVEFYSPATQTTPTEFGVGTRVKTK